MARSDVEQYLRDNFLKEGNLKWKALGGTLSGGVLAAFLSGLISVPIAAGKAIERGTEPIRAAIDNGGSDLADTISSSTEQAWGAFDFALFSLPVTVASVLVAFLIIAWGWNRYA